ncbi:MAG TPA: response regulator [Candidatus Cybelea sp.]|nr:response regulator [Candidatus Cybelea sp.]
MNDVSVPAANRAPTVYFIDDSATMREVIKIALRKEHIHVITCSDAASALAQFTTTPPDAVITDVIMPDKDGYEVCEFMRRHEQFAKTPVILMSGVVNRAVAERATAVGADELVRKPFQPQELIARVKRLLRPEAPAVIRAEDLDAAAPAPPRDSHPLQSLFAAPQQSRAADGPAARTETPVLSPVRAGAPALPAGSPIDALKLRSEIRRLELLVKRLESELHAQREYCTALEAHLKTLQETE